jgi:hypothetical protein
VSTYKGFLAVWRPGNGTLPYWVSGFDQTKFENQIDEYFQVGIRLKCLDLLRHGAWTGVWRPGTGAQIVHKGLTATELEDKNQEYGPQGLRLAILRARRDTV